MTLTADFDAFIEPYHEALSAIINGDPSIYKEFFSERDDVTLGNPFGPFGRGRGEIEMVAKLVTPELAYLVEVERCRAKVGSSEALTPVSLRVTSIFRPENGV